MNENVLQRVVEISQRIGVFRTRLRDAEAELKALLVGPGGDGGPPPPPPTMKPQRERESPAPLRQEQGATKRRKKRVHHRMGAEEFQTAVLEVFDAQPLRIFSNREVAVELGILRHKVERNRLNAQLWAFWQKGILEKLDKGRYASAKTKPGDKRNGSSHGSDVEKTRQEVSSNQSSSSVPLRAS